jgi:hypothetical protein
LDADVLLEIFRQRLHQLQTQWALRIGFDELQRCVGTLRVLGNGIGCRLSRLRLNADWKKRDRSNTGAQGRCAHEATEVASFVFHGIHPHS